jgi:hypothetical protein
MNFTLTIYKIFHMSSRNHEENNSGHNMDLHLLCVSYPTRNECRTKCVHSQPAYHSSLKNGLMGLPRGGKRPWRVFYRNLDVRLHSDDPKPSMWTTSTCTRLIGRLNCELNGAMVNSNQHVDNSIHCKSFEAC